MGMENRNNPSGTFDKGPFYHGIKDDLKVEYAGTWL